MIIQALIETEAEVSISIDDITNAISECTDSMYSVKKGINNSAQFLKAIPDEIISKMTSSERKTIKKLLLEQAARFNVLKD